MKIKISDRDKGMLIVLAVFFAALGYYYYVFTPLANMSGESGKQLSSKRTQLNMEKVKIRQFRTWQNYRKRLGTEVKRIREMIKAPPSSKSASERIDAVMNAAREASVTVDNIKPIPEEEKTGRGGTSEKKVISKFMIDGSCSFQSFLDFMSKVYGMQIEQITLSSSGGKSGKLRFTLILISLPAVKLDISYLKDIKVKASGYKIKHNPFELKSVTETDEKRLTPEELKEKREKELKAKLSSLKLEGTATFDGRKLAVISGPDMKERIFRTLHEGEKIKDVEIVKITRNAVEFMNDHGISCIISMDGNSSVSYDSSPETHLKDAGKPHLGLKVHVLDKSYSRIMGLKQTKGLLVLKSKKGCSLRPGDIIKSIAELKIISVSDAVKSLNKYKPGNIVKVGFIRNGKALDANVKLD